MRAGAGERLRASGEACLSAMCSADVYKRSTGDAGKRSIPRRGDVIMRRSKSIFRCMSMVSAMSKRDSGTVTQQNACAK